MVVRFSQVRGIPEKLLEGRADLEHDWIFRHLTVDESRTEPLDRAVYFHAYRTADAIRTGDAWHQTFAKNVIDDGSYGTLEMPVRTLVAHSQVTLGCSDVDEGYEPADAQN